MSCYFLCSRSSWLTVELLARKSFAQDRRFGTFRHSCSGILGPSGRLFSFLFLIHMHLRSTHARPIDGNDLYLQEVTPRDQQSVYLHVSTNRHRGHRCPSASRASFVQASPKTNRPDVGQRSTGFDHPSHCRGLVCFTLGLAPPQRSKDAATHPPSPAAAPHDP